MDFFKKKMENMCFYYCGITYIEYESPIRLTEY